MGGRVLFSVHENHDGKTESRSLFTGALNAARTCACVDCGRDVMRMEYFSFIKISSEEHDMIASDVRIGHSHHNEVALQSPLIVIIVLLLFTNLSTS